MRQSPFPLSPSFTVPFFHTVCRYVERNALRARLVDRAESWRWSSLWHRFRASPALPLADWPVPIPSCWLDYVQQPETEAELAVLRQSVRRGAPFGDTVWQQPTAARLGLQTTLRPRGRPRQQTAEF